MDVKILFKRVIITIVFFYGLLLPLLAIAEHQHLFKIDMYRSNQISIDEIKQRYQSEFQTITNIFMEPEKLKNKKYIDQLGQLFTKVLNGISKSGNFSYVNLSPVFYQKNPVLYMTLDLIDKNDKSRVFRFLKKPEKDIPDKYHVVEAWREYQAMGFDLGLNKKVDLKFKSCPVWHCIFGFDYPAFKKYQKIFDSAPLQTNLVEMLRNDKNPEKRSAAAYLLAHTKDGRALIKTLIPSMYDSDAGVRNSVMRVLGETLGKIKDIDFPIEKAIQAIDFPTAVDRNKALYIISSLIKQPRYADYIKKHAGQQLIEQLKMSQENVHGLAYMILKKISGKQYAERDYQLWEKWVQDNK